ncbi:MAG: cation:proton antiporter [Thermomicrobiales bacterium]
MEIAFILVLGVGAQWLAWRLKLPSILLLLLCGLLAGPVTGVVKPDAIFGELLAPLVSLAVALVLFEGSLSLRIHELRETGNVVRNLLTIGAAVTWCVSTLAARFLLHFDLALALILGTILIVTGPTVIGPLLEHVKPRGRIGPILRWEGILIDPLGALLALLVFEAVLSSSAESATHKVIEGFGLAVLAGTLAGLGGAALLVAALRRYLVPDFLHNPATVTLVVAAFTLANRLHDESGLLAVTIMGILLANQPFVPVAHIIEFKENLRVLLLAGLFIVLAARLQPHDLAQLGPGSVLFVLVLLLVARPLGVLLATAGSDLTRNERLFLAWMAPRGVVAASVASIFALRLAQVGYPNANQLTANMFLVIICTVAIYGLTASPLARRLGVRQRRPHGTLIAGADLPARAIGAALVKQGCPVVLVDINPAHVADARHKGLPALVENILAEGLLDEVALEGIGRLLALTPNDEVNALAALRFASQFGWTEVYQLPVKGPLGAETSSARQPLRGRLLFGPSVDHAYLARQLAAGGTIEAITLDVVGEEADRFGDDGAVEVPLFVLTETGDTIPCTTTSPPQPGQTVLMLVTAGPPVPAESSSSLG